MKCLRCRTSIETPKLWIRLVMAWSMVFGSNQAMCAECHDEREKFDAPMPDGTTMVVKHEEPTKAEMRDAMLNVPEGKEIGRITLDQREAQMMADILQAADTLRKGIGGIALHKTDENTQMILEEAIKEYDAMYEE